MNDRHRIGDPDLEQLPDGSAPPEARGLWAEAFAAVDRAATADRRDPRDNDAPPHREYIGRPVFRCRGAELVSVIDGQQVRSRRPCGNQQAPGFACCSDCLRAETTNRRELRELLQRRAAGDVSGVRPRRF